MNVHVVILPVPLFTPVHRNVNTFGNTHKNQVWLVVGLIQCDMEKKFLKHPFSVSKTLPRRFSCSVALMPVW